MGLYNRLELKEKELRLLAEEFRVHPELFGRKTFVDAPELLDELGIFIPGHEIAPLGYIKLWPEDFIVEEISKDGHRESVTLNNPDPTENNAASPTIYASLIKENLSTIEAVDDIAGVLACDKSKIQYAGIKDKDALTAQRLSFRNIQLEDLKKISSPHFILTRLTTGKGIMERGGLSGNLFTILVRTQYTPPETFLHEQLALLERDGYYNFFYLQRFGTPRLINYFWGYLILRGEYEEAVKSFLTSGTERELGYFREFRESMKEFWGDWGKFEREYGRFPLIFANELRIIRHLQKNYGDFNGALRTIPEQITLWIYAFSSWLFNNKLSSYLKINQPPPEQIPIALSYDRNAWQAYKDILDRMEIYPPPLKNLQMFPGVQLKKTSIATREEAKVEKIKIVSEGLIISFLLRKGSYATSFLSHLFQLASGAPPNAIRVERIDTKASLEEGPITETLKYFEGVAHSKADNIFENLLA